eukprot:Nk52_evm2s262 gene=Nk52_evmTU2s262
MKKSMRSVNYYIFQIIVVCAVLAPPLGSFGYLLQIDPEVKQCFFESLKVQQPLTVSYSVTHGGSLDIDFQMLDTNGRVVKEHFKSNEGKETLHATVAGKHKFCFSNEMSRVTEKTVLFSVVVDEDEQAAQSDNMSEARQELGETIQKLEAELRSVKSGQDHMEVRDRIHFSGKNRNLYTLL